MYMSCIIYIYIYTYTCVSVCVCLCVYVCVSCVRMNMLVNLLLHACFHLYAFARAICILS